MVSRDDKARRKQLKDQYLRAEQAADAALMPLDRRRLQALLDCVSEAVEHSGCEHTLTATESWASAHAVDIVELRAALAVYGGFCDCEVVMNVNASAVFDAVRQDRSSKGSNGPR